MSKNLFQDRKDAGEQLGEALKKFSLKNAVVVGLPRGGIVVADAVAKVLQTTLYVLVPRKIGAPGNPELAIGALAGDEVVLDQELIDRLSVSKDYLSQEIARQKIEAKRREKLYQKGMKGKNWKGAVVIVVDDGIATGATMRVSLRYLRAQGAKFCLAAVPVAPQDTVARFKKEGEEIFSLYEPSSFFAVGQFYERFSQTEDSEVLEILKKYGA